MNRLRCASRPCPELAAALLSDGAAASELRIGALRIVVHEVRTAGGSGSLSFSAEETRSSVALAKMGQRTQKELQGPGSAVFPRDASAAISALISSICARLVAS